jgi:hypothetical protein
MKRKDITTALKARLEEGATGIPGAWPNVGYSGVTPYFDVQWPAANRTTPALNGGTVIEEGRMSAAVAVDADTGEAEANDFADTIAALFPKGLRLPITGGVITIADACDIRPGYRADDEWRVPVIVKYRAHSI